MRYPLVLLLPVGIVAVSLGWIDSTPSESPAPEAYTQWCSSCHGAEGQNFVDRDWKLGSTADAVRRVIEEGNELLGMPAYGSTLSASEIDSIAVFVLEQAASKRGFKPASPELIESSDLTLCVNTIVNGLETPWGMDFVNDTTLLITEREGRLWKLEAGRLDAIEGLPNDIHVKGQGGLLDVMHWRDNDAGKEWVFLTYSKDRPGDSGQSATALIRAPWSAETERIEAWEELFVATPYEKTHLHYGSRVEIGGDGKLYLTCGERGRRDVHPQTLTTSPGKVHRFNPDGSIPEDNPFVNQPNAVPSIWSWGHRNPQGMFCHPETGTIWTHEHGPKGGDEINIPEPGNNYGWSSHSIIGSLPLGPVAWTWCTATAGRHRGRTTCSWARLVLNTSNDFNWKATAWSTESACSKAPVGFGTSHAIRKERYSLQLRAPAPSCTSNPWR